MSEIENRRRIEALEKDVTDLRASVSKLQGANEVLSKRILEEIKKAQRTRV